MSSEQHTTWRPKVGEQAAFFGTWKVDGHRVPTLVTIARETGDRWVDNTGSYWRKDNLIKVSGARRGARLTDPTDPEVVAGKLANERRISAARNAVSA